MKWEQMKIKREHVKDKFEDAGWLYYKTKKGNFRKSKIFTTEKSIIVTEPEFMTAWDNHFDLFYA